MRITFLAPALDLSGGTQVIAIYAKELAELGHKVSVVSLPQARDPLRTKARSFLTGNGWPKLAPLVPIRNAEHIVLNERRAVLDTDVPDADAVIATWWETAEWASTLSPMKGRKHHFIQHHEVFHYLPARAREVYRLPFKKIVVAGWLKDLMASEYGDNDASLVPNTVDRSAFYAPPRSKNALPVVGMLYNTAEFKGMDVALEAIRLARLSSQFQVVSFGSQPVRPNLPLPNGSRFFLRPSLDRIREIYSSCDVWLTCSRSEGFNLPALEAMACRVPIVSTKTGWPAEGIIDGRNGALVDIDDAQGAAAGILSIINLPDNEWKHMSECAYRTTTTSGWKESAKLFEAALIS